jgi:hypothetical protein
MRFARRFSPSMSGRPLKLEKRTTRQKRDQAAGHQRVVETM